MPLNLGIIRAQVWVTTPVDLPRVTPPWILPIFLGLLLSQENHPETTCPLLSFSINPLSLDKFSFRILLLFELIAIATCVNLEHIIVFK